MSCRRAIWATVLVPCFAVVLGCNLPMPDRAERMQRSYVYYLDGAGGGGLISNWAGGVRQGLLEAGYDGAGEIFRWNTGLGVVADQTADAHYKRGKAADLASQIVEYKRAHPSAPVTLMGLSAGTAVAAFALEALPPGVMVDTVILLSGSLNCEYDLTRALQHVAGKLYVFTSNRDEVLMFAVPWSGTADQESSSTCTIGVEGPRLPRRARSSETRALYGKVVQIPWNEGFARYGDFGGHTDVVKAPFVKAFVAPLVMKGPRERAAAPTVIASGHVTNPDYERWSHFEPGSWVQFEGYQVLGGVRERIQMRATLKDRQPDHLLVERRFRFVDATNRESPLNSEFFVLASVASEQHPTTDPRARRRDLADETLTIRSQPVRCRVRTVRAAGPYPEWGQNIEATIASCPDIPGGMARVHLKTTLRGQAVEYAGQVSDYRALRR